MNSSVTGVPGSVGVPGSIPGGVPTSAGRPRPSQVRSERPRVVGVSGRREEGKGQCFKCLHW